MNIPNLTALLAHLRNIPSDAPQFDMRYYRHSSPDHNCNTVCCIAGHAVWLLEREKYNKYRVPVIAIAKEILDLTWEEQNWLFDGRFSSAEHLGDITLTEAIAAVEFLLENPGYCTKYTLYRTVLKPKTN